MDIPGKPGEPEWDGRGVVLKIHPALEVQFWKKTVPWSVGALWKSPSPVTRKGDFDLDESHFAVFYKVPAGRGAHKWSRDGAIKAFSRERRRIHVCRAADCMETSLKAWHAEELAVFPVGMPPAAYVESGAKDLRPRVVRPGPHLAGLPAERSRSRSKTSAEEMDVNAGEVNVGSPFHYEFWRQNVKSPF